MSTGRIAVRGTVSALAALMCAAVLAAPASAAPPVNDAFLTAGVLTGATATATGTTVEATKETAEPNHAGYAGGASVWYRWTAPSDGVAVIDTFGSSFDTLLGVYTGLTVGGLQHVASNDQWNGNQSRVKFAATAGTEYRIAVDGYGYQSGAVTLNVALLDAPANDAFANAAVLSGTSPTASGTNVSATAEPGEPWLSGGTQSVWWTWTAPTTTGVTISTAGSTFDTVLAAYTGSDVAGLITVAANDNAGTGVQSRISFRAEAGATYRIRVDGYYGAEGSIQLALAEVPLPANDAFAAATALPGTGDDLVTGSTLGASTEPGEPTHYGYESNGASVWYTWTAPSDGSLTLRADADHYAAVAVYTGTQVSDLTRVVNQAQEGWPGPEQVRVRVAAGVQYRIVVAGRGGAAGTFNLGLDLVPRPANDDFADAAKLVGLHDDATGTNVGATQEAGEPIHEENYYDPSVWFEWTAPSDAGVTVDTAGSTFSSVVAVYTGSSVSTLTRVVSTRANAGTAPERRHFRAAAGITYRIAVDGRGAAQGTYSLELDADPPPANDMFAAAQPIAQLDTLLAGDTRGATGEHQEPGDGGTGGATVWYRWTAGEDARAEVALENADFGATVGVYRGTTLAGLNQVASGSGWYRTAWGATAGTTYFIQVGGGSAPARGTFGLRLKTVPRPANDDFADAVALSGTSATGSGTIVGATEEAGEPNHYGYGSSSVWWRWTAPKDGKVTFDVSGSFDWTTAAYTGAAVDALTNVRSADYGPMQFAVAKGETYHFAVDSYYGDSGYYSGTVGDVGVSLVFRDAPRNDDIADATVLTGSADDVTGTTVGAGVEPYEQAHAGQGPAATVWYRWRAPAGGEVTLDTAGSAADTVLAVYDTSYHYYSPGALASNDDAGGSPQARTTFDATSGYSYWIAVDSKGGTGPIALSLRHGTPPANDDLAGATDATGSTQLPVTTTFATRQAGEPRHAGNDGGASVWFTWTAPEDGWLALNTGGSDFDTLLGLYTGSAVGALTQVAADDNGHDGFASALSAPVTAGTTYRIAVDGSNDRHGPRQGAGSLNLAFTPGAGGGPPPGGGDGTGGDDPPIEQEPPVETEEPVRTEDPAATEQPSSPDPPAQAAPPSTRAPVPPPPSPRPPTGAAPGPAPAAMTLTATVGSQRIARVLRRGLAGAAACSAACTLDVAVTASPNAAKARAAAAARASVVAKAANASTPFTVKVSGALRRLLKRSKAATVTVTITARGPAGSAVATRRVTLKR